MKSAVRPAIILFAHGSRDPQWAQPFKELKRALAARRPDATVALAYLEFMEPTLDLSIAGLARAGCRDITVAPLFMAQGAHLRTDLARILDSIRADHPGARITLLPAIGEVPAVIDAISDWLVAATRP
jgi:sirohydrochlorin cobaltochelatase